MAGMNCIKCVYPKEGPRICKHCSRPHDVPKHEWKGRTPRGKTTAGVEHVLVSPSMGRDLGLITVADLLGDDPAREPVAPVPTDASVLKVVEPSSTPTEAATSAPNAEPVSAKLPAHSKLGGSGAKRWMNCTGSTALLAQLKPTEEEEPDFTKEGTQAHELAARCLETDGDAWELIHEYTHLKYEHLDPINVYINYVRSRPGRLRVEVKHHRPELHRDMFSTIDAELIQVGPEEVEVEIIDFKFGAGVYVPADDPQLKYYAVMVIMEEGEDFYDPNTKVRLTVVQPRLDWADEVIRHHDTTVRELVRWLHGELMPAMHVAAEDMVFSMGEWCRFCKAKLVCPAMSASLKMFAGIPVESLAERSDEELGELFVKSEPARMLLKALKDEVLRRLMNGRKVPGGKLIAGRADRVWKDKVDAITIAEALEKQFGAQAWAPQKLISPAVAEALEGGKDFVATYAFKPEVAPTVALVTAPGKEVSPPTPEAIYGDPAQYRA